MAFGLDASGFTLKRLNDIRADLENAFRAEFGDDIRVGPSSIFGVLIGIFSEPLAEAWELAQGVWWVLNPDQAEGVQLDRAAAILGLEGLEATSSQVDVDAFGDAGTVIPAGSQVSHDSTGAIFVTLAEATIPDDGGGTGTISIATEAQETGEVEAAAGTLTVIETPVTGWDSVTNPADAELGRDEESDPELRARIRDSLEIAGSATVEAIKARLEEVDGVLSVYVVENATGSVDAAGRDPHTFEAIVQGGDDTEIAEKIWANKAAGIRSVTTGAGALAVTVTITDSQGFDHDIDFTRPETVEIWIDIQITTGGDIFTADEEDEIITAVLAEANSLGAGDDVRPWRLEKAVADLLLVQEHNDDVSDITIALGDSGAYDTLTEVVISETQIPDFDSLRTKVTES